MIRYHMIAFLAGFLLDLIIGDPYWLPHPIRWIGSLISHMEQRLLEPLKAQKTADSKKEFQRGILLVIAVVTPSVALPFTLLVLGYGLHPVLGILLESVMTYQLLATKCLKKESMKVYQKLMEGDLPGARVAVSMIVGRDTDALDDIGVTKAAVETVAENASDGVIAPMLYLAVFGPVGGFFYKAVNTMDSMVGYKNERYLHFGRCAAKCDDVLNFLPARISALLLILAHQSWRAFSAKRAWRYIKETGISMPAPILPRPSQPVRGAWHPACRGCSLFWKSGKKAVHRRRGKKCGV